MFLCPWSCMWKWQWGWFVQGNTHKTRAYHCNRMQLSMAWLSVIHIAELLPLLHGHLHFISRSGHELDLQGNLLGCVLGLLTVSTVNIAGEVRRSMTHLGYMEWSTMAWTVHSGTLLLLNNFTEHFYVGCSCSTPVGLSHLDWFLECNSYSLMKDFSPRTQVQKETAV